MSADSYDSAPRQGSEPVWTRVYRRGGHFAHLWEAGAACPIIYQHYADTGNWYGTGSQEEYEAAAAKPLCRRCFAAREARLPDPRLGTAHGTEMT